MTDHPTAISAPGKVLLAGGYLVLDRQYTGLTLGLNARIHTHIEALPTSDGVSLQEIIVASPQFRFAVWRYGYHTLRDGGGVGVTQLRVGPDPVERNTFLEAALSYALSYIDSSTDDIAVIQPSRITILADTDYYSNNANRRQRSESSSAPERFEDFGIPLWDAHKTGLGSSAALVTSVIGAVLTHYLPQETFSIATQLGKERLHNLAQAAHSAAQGKIGSGFDVASAVFGSCTYRRFSPSVVECIGDLGSEHFRTRLKDIVDDEKKVWDVEVAKSAVTIPKGLRLVMCDVDCGSKTPGMVKNVLEWRKSNPEVARTVWDSLQEKNERLAAQLVSLEKGAKTEYESLANTIADIRKLVRHMSELSGVPIEPPAQTALLDGCSSLQGVIGGVAPGAGGYDAVALIIEDKPHVFAELNDFLRAWKFGAGTEEEAVKGKVRLLRVREEMEGIREEDAAGYKNWIKTSTGM